MRNMRQTFELGLEILTHEFSNTKQRAANYLIGTFCGLLEI